MTAEVDLLIVFHNSRQWIPDLMASLRQLSLPIRAYFLDNASKDGTADLLAEEVQSLPFRAYVLRSIRNNGFAGGVNLLAAQSQAEFMIVLITEGQTGAISVIGKNSSLAGIVCDYDVRKVLERGEAVFDLKIRDIMITTVRGVSLALKLVMVCSTPSSKTLKSRLSIPPIRVPFLSATTTSKFTRSTSIAIGFPVWASFGAWEPGGGAGRPPPASLRGPCAKSAAPAKRNTMTQSVVRNRMGVVSGVSLSECPSAAQDFDLLLPSLIDANLQQRQRLRQSCKHPPRCLMEQEERRHHHE